MGGSRLLGAKLDQGAGISGGSVTSFQKLFFSLQDRDQPKQRLQAHWDPRTSRSCCPSCILKRTKVSGESSLKDNLNGLWLGGCSPLLSLTSSPRLWGSGFRKLGKEPPQQNLHSRPLSD